MSRISNIHDLHKTRRAWISERYDKLTVYYEGLDLLGMDCTLDNKEFQLASGGSGYVTYQNRTLKLEINIEEDNLDKLYKIFCSIAYLLGDGITLHYFYASFPYYRIPHDYNFGGYLWLLANHRRLVIETARSINAAYKMLSNADNAKLVSKIVQPMLIINTIAEPNIRFFSEYSILEFLAQRQPVRGKIFSQADDKKLLKVFIQSLKECLREHEDGLPSHVKGNPYFAAKLKDLEESITNVNVKGVWKDKINAYIEACGPKLSGQYLEYAGRWGKLRNQSGIAHGNILNGVGDKNDSANDRLLRGKLHEFLADIVMKEYEEYLEK